MPNVTLAIDGDLLRESRAYARDNGTSLNALIRDLLERTVKPETDVIEDMIAYANELQLDSGGWKWNREELYEEMFNE